MFSWFLALVLLYCLRLISASTNFSSPSYHTRFAVNTNLFFYFCDSSSDRSVAAPPAGDEVKIRTSAERWADVKYFQSTELNLSLWTYTLKDPTTILFLEEFVPKLTRWQPHGKFQTNRRRPALCFSAVYWVEEASDWRMEVHAAGRDVNQNWTGCEDKPG